MATTMELTVFENLAQSFTNIIPNALGALLLLIFGWLVGRVIHGVLLKVLRKLRIDSYMKLEHGFRISEIFSTVTKWIIYLVFIQSALEVLGIVSLSAYFQQVTSLLGGLVGGVVVLLIAYLLAKYLQKEVKGSKTEYSGLMSQLIFFFVMVIAVSIAFEVASIPNDLINVIIVIMVGSVGLGFAIALGLGLKGSVARIAKKYEKKI